MSVIRLVSSSTLSAGYRLPLKRFSCYSMFGHYIQSIRTLLVWFIFVSYCSVAVWPAVAGSTKCILMFLCVTWHRQWYIWQLYIDDIYVAYCSVAVWPAVPDSTKCILIFLCVTWHRQWYIWLLYVADSYVHYSTILYCTVVTVKPGHVDWVRDFDFRLNLLSLPSPSNYYLFLRRIPYHFLWSHPRNRPPVNIWESQSLAAASIPQRFGQCICSKLQYVCCTKDMFKHEQELVNKVFMLYVFQIGLLNKLLLSWWCVTCTHTKLPQGPVQYHLFFVFC